MNTPATATTATFSTVATAATATTARRILVALLLALTLLTGTAITSPTAAEATTNANVSFCYKHPNGVRASNLTVHLLEWNGSQWLISRTGKSNSQGCGVFYNVPRNRHHTTLLYQVIGNPSYCGNYGYTASSFTGYAPSSVYTNGYGNHYVGMGTVQQHRFC